MPPPYQKDCSEYTHIEAIPFLRRIMLSGQDLLKCDGLHKMGIIREADI
jgi:hypothetical protein